MVRRVIRGCLTLGPIGYLPAPGTCGTIAAIPLWYAVRHGLSFVDERISLFALAAIAWWAIDTVLVDYTSHDPSELVIDEVIGFAVAMYMFPFDWRYVAVIFAIFRLFDIAKPFQIAQAEAIPGAFGIILDDVIAGIFTNIVMSIVVQWL